MSTQPVKEDLQAATTREETDAILKSAYMAGHTLQSLGDILGVTRERIRQRVAHPIDPDMLRNYQPAERIKQREEDQRNYRASKKRIMGLPMSSPALRVPVETLNEITRLRELTTEVRGWTPLDSPERQALKPLGDLLFETFKEYQIPMKHLEKLVGVKGATLTTWLKNHGYLEQSPSQKSYRGVVVEQGKARAGKTKLVPGSMCGKGHALTDELISVYGSARQCKQCKRDSANRRYQERKRKAE